MLDNLVYELLAWAFTRVYMALLLASPLKCFTAFTQKALNVSMNMSECSYISNVLICVFGVFTLNRFTGVVFQMSIEFTTAFEPFSTFCMEAD